MTVLKSVNITEMITRSLASSEDMLILTVGILRGPPPPLKKNQGQRVSLPDLFLGGGKAVSVHRLTQR